MFCIWRINATGRKSGRCHASLGLNSSECSSLSRLVCLMVRACVRNAATWSVSLRPAPPPALQPSPELVDTQLLCRASRRRACVAGPKRSIDGCSTLSSPLGNMNTTLPELRRPIPGGVPRARERAEQRTKGSRGRVVGLPILPLTLCGGGNGYVSSPPHVHKTKDAKCKSG